MKCKNAIIRLAKLLDDLLKNFEHPFLSIDDIIKIVQQIERLISYINNNCKNLIGTNLFNKLDLLLKGLNHFFEIRESVDEEIIYNENLEIFLKQEIAEIIKELKNI